MEAAESHPDWMREMDALRRVARGLLHDEHATDDALQDAWVRAHTRATGHPENPPAFWKRVVANLSRDRRRGDARRAEREAHAARAEALPSTDEVAARLELAQRVARAAAELTEPYRSTIHLHYFEDLSAAEIAARASVPLETVRTRIRRGLAHMRASLDTASDGDRQAWSLALAPLALRGSRDLPAAASGALVVTTTTGILAVSKPLILAASALAALALLWFGVRADSSLRPDDVRAVAPVAPPEAPVTPTARQVQLEHILVAQDSRATIPVQPASPSPAAELELVGTFTLVDDAGRRQTDLDGMFYLEHIADDGSSEGDFVMIEAGRWRARVAAHEQLAFHHCLAAGHPARLIAPPTSAPADGVLALEARAWPRTHLRVVEASSGRDLEQVELRWGTMNYITMATRHPGDVGPWDIQQSGLRSPFELELSGGVEESQSLRLWVRAPGLAWNFCDVLPAAGGTRTVALSPGGNLEVYPSGPRPGSPWMIYLVERRGETSEEMVAWQVPSDSEVTRLDDLAPGTYVVGAMPRDLATGLSGSSEPFEVRAGETTRVALSLDELPAEAQQTHLTGTLNWSAGTQPGNLRIDPTGQHGVQDILFLDVSDMTPDSEHPRRLHWDAGLVACGEYVAFDGENGYRQSFDTGRAAEHHLEVVLAPRTQVVVRALDMRDGSAILTANAAWSLAPTTGAYMQHWMEYSDAHGQGFVRFEAPACALVLVIGAPGFASLRQEIALEAGSPHEIVVRLLRETGLRIELTEGDAVVPRTYVRPRIQDPADERVKAHDWSWSSNVCTVLLDPGSYRLSFEGLDATWSEPGWIDVDVVADRLTPVRFPLERAP